MRITQRLTTLVMGVIMALAIICAPALAQVSSICALTDTSVKYEAIYDGELDAVVLAEGTKFCVKAGPDNTGELVSDGETPLIVYVEEAGIRVGNDNVPAVSHYVIYEVEPTPEPPVEPTPNPEPPVEPTPEPEEPTETPIPVEPDEGPGDGAKELPKTGLGSTLALLAGGLGSVGFGTRMLRRK